MPRTGLREPLYEIERRLGDFAPAVVDREGVATVGDLHDLRHTGVAPLPLVASVEVRQWHQVGLLAVARWCGDRPWRRLVLPTVDDQQGTAVGVLRVNLRLRPRVEVRVAHLDKR